MDPVNLLRKALDGHFQSRLDYNRLGIPVSLKVFLPGETMPTLMAVDYLGPALVRGTCGLVFPARKYVTYQSVIPGTIIEREYCDEV